MFGFPEINCKQCAPRQDANSDTVKVDMVAFLEKQEKDLVEKMQRQEKKLQQLRKTKDKAKRRSSSRERRGPTKSTAWLMSQPETIEETSEREDDTVGQSSVQQDTQPEAKARFAIEGLRLLLHESEKDLLTAAQLRAEHTDEQLRLAKDRERKIVVGAFLKEFGFAGVQVPKRKLMKTTYSLHKAVKFGDVELGLVQMLIEEGANPEQKDSRGKTPAQVAALVNKDGSHAKVLELLGHDGSLTSRVNVQRGGA